MAREAGLDESQANLIDDRYASADLNPDWVVALEFTDRFINAPGPLPDDLSLRLQSRFDSRELTELALGLALFHGFSKMLIALGLEPDEMDTTIVETPKALGSSDHAADYSDPRVALLSNNPDLAARWETMRDAVTAAGHMDDELIELAASRVSELIGDGRTHRSAMDRNGPEARMVLELAELFVVDVRAIDAEHLTRLENRFGRGGVVQIVMALAIADGIERYAATVGPLMAAAR